MNKHRKVRLLLYEYLRSELNREDEHFVSDHLRSCPSCSAEADEMRSLLRLFPGEMEKPSDRQDPEYWSGFAGAVEKRIHRHRATAPGFLTKLNGLVGDLFLFRRKFAYGLVSVCAAAVLITAVMMVRWRTGAPVPAGTGGGRLTGQLEVPAEKSPSDRAGQSGNERTGTSERIPGRTAANGISGERGSAGDDSLTDFDRRLGGFFRKSRTLLVGVSNMDFTDGNTLNFEGERRMSRSLLREARYLKSGPVDIRSSKLMDEIDEIMIELANVDPPDRRRGVDMVRAGIRNKNLLFKLRMHETRYTHVVTRAASYQPERDVK